MLGLSIEARSLPLEVLNLPSHQERTQTVEYQQLNAIHKDEVKTRVGQLIQSALLSQGASELELREIYSKSIAWSGIKRYKVDVISFRGLVIGHFERLKKQCVERKLLSEAEAETLRPNLIITVRDMRENKTPPLPEISGVAKFDSH